VIFALPHCEQKFLPVFGTLYWSATWRQLHFFDLDRPVVDLSWQVARGVLYTVDRLISFGYSHDHHCFCGPVNETPSHLFFGCALASSLLSWLQFLMFHVSPRCPTLSCRHVLFGFSPSELRAVPRVFIDLLCLLKYFVWRARNDFRFHDVRPSALPIIENTKARAKFHLVLFMKHFKSSRHRRYFHRQWGACSVVGSAEDGIFKFCLLALFLVFLIGLLLLECVFGFLVSLSGCTWFPFA